jgi:hypothetical protein
MKLDIAGSVEARRAAVAAERRPPLSSNRFTSFC